MEIILKFDSVEEAEDARIALDGHKYRNILWDLDQLFRQCVKYSNSFMDKSKLATEAEVEICDRLREILREYLEQYNVTIE